MVKHVWTVICSRAVIDRESNNVSLENVLERIRINAEPEPDGFIGIPFTVISLWIRENDELPTKSKTRLEMVSPSGETRVVNEVDVDLTEYIRFRSITRFSGIPADRSGRYSFRVAVQQEGSKDWDIVAEVPLSVTFIQKSDRKENLELLGEEVPSNE